MNGTDGPLKFFTLFRDIDISVHNSFLRTGVLQKAVVGSSFVCFLCVIEEVIFGKKLVFFVTSRGLKT